MATHADVLAICVNWNGSEVLRPTVDALQKSTYRPLQIVLVDNASTDDSIEGLPSDIEIVRMGENRGYGAAINRIWREVLAGSRKRPAYYLVLNNDVMVEPDLVGRLVEFATGREPGIYGPKILQWQRRDLLDMAWGTLRWHHVLADYKGKRAIDGPPWNEPREVELLQGSVLLVDSRVVESIGLFDEQFFMYHEEVDFLYRARQHGCRSYYCPFTRAYHWGAHSTESRPLQKTFWTRRNAVYFMRKHASGIRRWPYFLVTLAGSILYSLLSLNRKRAQAIVSGVKAGFAMPVIHD